MDESTKNHGGKRDGTGRKTSDGFLVKMQVRFVNKEEQLAYKKLTPRERYLACQTLIGSKEGK